MTGTGDVQTSNPSVAPSFREAMAAVCTPVAVVTAMDGKRPHGTTVSAVMSLSMNPPMVAVALDNNSELLEIIRASGIFAVNILSADQSLDAQTFAAKGREKFDGVGWELDNQAPRLNNLSSWVACEKATFAAGGDHTIVSGTVVTADSAPHRQPLTYHRRQFGTHSSRTTDPRDAHVR